ncbi:hypothetical protein [Lentilactobacillus kosonis]|uniref:Acetyl-CoA carboxylase n=1 Tax=Lentilactobacillus kosonis TaxID=2810561 RepID=A0A401FNP6_9LACO|nr:hypothetical protein [Lentilactobacillus kosonis]GAY73841.1 hypothetical protein NBRC111893_1987 [Lentilactobacillus kosonis]
MIPAHEARIIADKIKPLFKNIRGDHYKLQIIDSKQNKQYTIFFSRQPKNGSMIVNPVYTIDEYKLEHLENVLNELENYYKFTQEYRGFVGQLWPSNGNPVQFRKESREL